MSSANPTPPDSIRPHSIRPSSLEQFFSRFFQQRNIRWMLIAGAAIVFGSSLMLVTRAWPDWSPAIRCLTVVGYTSVIFACGEFVGRRWRLRSTSHALRALTLLLLPICFLSLTWVSAGTAVTTMLSWLLLMMPCGALLWIASGRIFADWLGRPQATYLYCFRVLVAAGALPVIPSAVAAMALVIAGWMVLSAGAIKVNDHAFWLTRIHRQPPVLAFVPAILLAIQFTLLVATKSVAALPTCWIGLAFVLVAGTVLVTAKRVADLYRREPSGLSRPLPWAVSAPLALGLLLMVVGVAASFAGFRMIGETTYALIPTAAIAAGLFFLAARDLRAKSLIYATLVCVAIAYQASPVLFSDWVATMRDATAEAIHRTRVPLSLYGVTYAPLLITLTAVAAWWRRRGERDLIEPVKTFVASVSAFWLVFSLTDAIAFWFVSAASVFLFVIYAVAFVDRRLLLPALISLIAAVAAGIPAGNQMMWWAITPDWVPVALVGLAIALTATDLPDRLMRRITLPGDRRDGGIGDLMETSLGPATAMGCVLALVGCLHWAAIAWMDMDRSPTRAFLVEGGGLLLATSVFVLRRRDYASAWCLWLFVGYAAVMIAARFCLPATVFLAIATVAMLGSVVGIVVVRRITPTWQPLVSSFTHLSFATLTALVGVLFVPGWMAQHLAGPTAVTTMVPGLTLAGFAAVSGLVVVWTLVVGRHLKQGVLVAITGWMLPAAMVSGLAAMRAETLWNGTLPAGQMGLTWAITQVGWLAAWEAARFAGKGRSFLPTVRPAAWASVIGLSGIAMLVPTSFAPAAMVAIVVGLAGMAAARVAIVIERQTTTSLVDAGGLVGAAAGLAVRGGLVSIDGSVGPLVILSISVAALTIDHFVHDRESAKILSPSMRRIGLTLPILASAWSLIAIAFLGSLELASTVMLVSAGIYFQRSLLHGDRRWFLPAVGLTNLALALVWVTVGITASECFLVPAGASMLAIVQLLRDRLPKSSHDPLRYIAVVLIVGGSLMRAIGGDWVAMFVLLVLAVLVILVAIGLRLKSWMYAGSAVGAIDLVAMILRSTMHDPTLLWIAGVGLGAAVIALAAYCENRREDVLARIRLLSAELATWN